MLQGFRKSARPRDTSEGANLIHLLLTHKPITNLINQLYSQCALAESPNSSRWSCMLVLMRLSIVAFRDFFDRSWNACVQIFSLQQECMCLTVSDGAASTRRRQSCQAITEPLARHPHDGRSVAAGKRDTSVFSSVTVGTILHCSWDDYPLMYESTRAVHGGSS
jgi:hypothetical protein